MQDSQSLSTQTPLQAMLQSLNPQQLEAVECIDGALLILAGAGSGKTKTLTTRLAYLIEEVGIPAQNTLTLTFTNKAAKEMRERALSLLQNHNATPPLLCTFHRFGLLFLRFYIHLLGRSVNFSLLDSTDCKRIVKKINPNIPPQRILSYISSNKNAYLSAQEAKVYSKNPEYKLLQKAYVEYEAFLLANNMLDFDDLLYLTCKILESNPALCEQTSQKYQYIMVDEYQDTNELQARLLRHLTMTHQNICVVGDDDQSIYSWRGADISNILEFQKNFANAHIIKLERNYRSTPQILRAANMLIAKNKKRLGKELDSQNDDGEEISLLYSDDEISEGNTIAELIKTQCKKGAKFEDFAILFRLNALSRGLEEALLRAKVPFKIIGSLRFYEREEIKDVLSYLRFIVNGDDNFSLLRILNKPKRGLGKLTQERIESFANSKNLAIEQAFKLHKEELGALIGAKNIKTLEEFFAMVGDLREKLEGGIEEFLESFESVIDFSAEFSKVENVDKMANIAEFYGALRDFAQNNDELGLEDFLNDIALSSSSDESAQDSVSCMSVHSAKGLEFERVFVVGMEEGFFPLIHTDSDLEEERRLGYVAITRAKKKLYLSSVSSRLYRGKREFSLPRSRFLRESGLIDSHNNEKDLNIESCAKTCAEICVNDLVKHKLFGTGRVLEVKNQGTQTTLKINFGGTQRIILSSFVQKL